MIDLQTLIDQERTESMLPEYQNRVSDAEVCGILVAHHHFKWDGYALVEMAAAALEDANLHDYAAELRKKLPETA